MGAVVCKMIEIVRNIFLYVGQHHTHLLINALKEDFIASGICGYVVFIVYVSLFGL